MYVPDLGTNSLCSNLSRAYGVPSNVTHQANLPAADFTLIAVAPWINAECTQAYLASARGDPVRAFLFYLPDNGTAQPPSISSSAWGLDDGGQWKITNQFPVYAIPSSTGVDLVHASSLYSGNMTSVPYGHQIAGLPNGDPRDYVRMYTKIKISRSSTIPGLWAYFLIVIAILIVMLCFTSGTMHTVQKTRRRSLRRRITNGEVNLEALGESRHAEHKQDSFLFDLVPEHFQSWLQTKVPYFRVPRG